MARTAERVSRQQERERARLIKEGERRTRSEEQERARLSKEGERRTRSEEQERAKLSKEYEREARLEKQRVKQDYYERRNAEADELNAQLDEQLSNLNSILNCALNRDPSIDFDKFLKYPTEANLDFSQLLLLSQEPQREKFLPKKPSPSSLYLYPGSMTGIMPA
jgi:hypothetical protein